jgi:dihydropteroate synthase
MGVLNLTPDSFSDGGLWSEPDRAVRHGLEMIELGAEVIDLGAESTRPGGGVYGGGAKEISAAEEIDRLLPVLEALRKATRAPISVDSRKSAVVESALAAGADLVNDISALADPKLAATVARADCPVVLMHSRGSLDSMQTGIHFDDVTAEVRGELEAAVGRAIEAGVRRSQIIVDPGIGFGKTARQNIELLSNLDAFNVLGPVLVGASRKSFIGDITGAEVSGRLSGSLAAVAWAARNGAAIVRVHDVEETVQFLEVWREIANARGVTR